MLDFVKELTSLQLVIIGAGVLVLFPTIKDLVLGLFTAERSEEETVTDVLYDTDLTAIVKKWEALADHCRDARLLEAHDRLEDLFPLLLRAKTPSAVKEEEPPTAKEEEDDNPTPPF
jgi:hypothetical protein